MCDGINFGAISAIFSTFQNCQRSVKKEGKQETGQSPAAGVLHAKCSTSSVDPR